MREWTQKERKIQACRARRTKPWKNATGPRTEKGKNAVRDNALQHGFRTAEGIELSRLLAEQKRFVATALLLAKMKKTDKSDS